MRPSNNLKNKTPSNTYWRVQLVCMKVQGHSFLEPPLEYNQDQTSFMNQGLLWSFLTILGVMEILCSFRLVLDGKTGKEIPESSRLAFLEDFSSNNFENWETLSRWKKVQIIEVQIKAVLLNYYWFNFFCHTLSLNYSSLTRDMNRTGNLTTRAFLQNAFISTVITCT